MNMKVHPVGHLNAVHSSANLARPGRTDGSKPSQAHADQSVEHEPPAASNMPVAGDTTPQGDHDGERAAGVLRLLEAGHFKGVADVRLRINFFDELTARASAAAAPRVQADCANLVETLNARIDELISPLADDEETQASIDELRGQFDAAVQTAVEEFASDDGVHTESLVGAIQAAFDTLVDQLRELLAEPVAELAPPQGEVEPPAAPSDEDADGVPGVADVAEEVIGAVEPVPTEEVLAGEEPPAQDVAPGATEDPPETVEPPADDGGDDANAVLEDALASLIGAFDDLLSGLLESVESTLQLPDPSPPSGNGGAYDKFLAIYNELRGLAPELDELS